MAFIQQDGILQQTVKKSVTLSATNHAIVVDEPDIDDLLNGITEFSISLWFKPSSALTTNGNIWSTLNTNGGNDGWALEVESATVLRIWAIDNFGLNDYLQADFNHSMVAGTWYHIVVTYDGSTDAAGVNVYINNVASTRTVVNDTLGDLFGGVIEANDDLQFGNGNFFGEDRQGEYDEITLWEDELTPAQVTTLYNSGIPGNPRTQLPSQTLRAWLRFDEDDLFYPTARDSQGNVTASYVNVPQVNITTDVLE
jgi:hypothetical protein